MLQDRNLKNEQECQRVFSEMGGKRELNRLIYGNPPTYLAQYDIKARLKSETSKLKDCRIYLFDRYFLLGSRKTEGGPISKLKHNSARASPKSRFLKGFDTLKRGAELTLRQKDKKKVPKKEANDIVWFGPQDPRSNEDLDELDLNEAANLLEDNDMGMDLINSYINMRSGPGLEESLFGLNSNGGGAGARSEFDLRLWVDLSKVTTDFSKKNDKLRLTITFTTESRQEIEPGVFTFESVVDDIDIYFEPKDVGKFDNISKTLDDAIEFLKGKRIEEEREAAKKDPKKDRVRPQPMGLGSRGSSNFPEAPSQLGGARIARTMHGSPANMHARSTNVSGFSRLGTSESMGSFIGKHSVDVNNETEARELKSSFVVAFWKERYGFEISSQPELKSGAIVIRLDPKGMAAQGGVTIGDKIGLINGVVVGEDLTVDQCKKMLKTALNNLPVRITFWRTKEAEDQYQEQKKEKENAQLEWFERKKVAEKERKKKLIAIELEAEKAREDAAGHSRNSMSKEVLARMRKLLADKKKAKQEKEEEDFSPVDPNTGVPLEHWTVDKHIKHPWNPSKTTIMSKVGIMTKSIQEFDDPDYGTEKKNDARTKYRRAYLFLVNARQYMDKGELTVLQIIDEFLRGELRYAADLQGLLEYRTNLILAKRYLRCNEVRNGSLFCKHSNLRAFCRKDSGTWASLLSVDFWDQIFSNLPTIRRVNCFLMMNIISSLNSFYCEMLLQERKINLFEVLGDFADIVKWLSENIRAYFQYLSNIDRARVLLENATRQYPEILEERQQMMSERYLDIEKLMIQPHEKLRHYSLFCDRLKREASKNLKKMQETPGIHPAKLEGMQKVNEKLAGAVGLIYQTKESLDNILGEAHEKEASDKVKEELKSYPRIHQLLRPRVSFLVAWLFDLYFQDTDSPDVLGIKTKVYVLTDRIIIAAPPEGKVQVEGEADALRFIQDFEAPVQSKGAITKIKETIQNNTSAMPKRTIASLSKNQRKSFRTAANTRRMTKISVAKKLQAVTDEDTSYEVLLDCALTSLAGFNKKSKQMNGDKILYGWECNYKTEKYLGPTLQDLEEVSRLLKQKAALARSIFKHANGAMGGGKRRKSKPKPAQKKSNPKNMLGMKIKRMTLKKPQINELNESLGDFADSSLSLSERLATIEKKIEFLKTEKFKPVAGRFTLWFDDIEQRDSLIDRVKKILEGDESSKTPLKIASGPNGDLGKALRLKRPRAQSASDDDSDSDDSMVASKELQKALNAPEKTDRRRGSGRRIPSFTRRSFPKSLSQKANSIGNKEFTKRAEGGL